MGSTVSPLATIGILSIGDMGVGIARLLLAHNFRVVTNASDRSEATQTRATQNGITLLPTDIDLMNASDYILSIVPPAESHATAQRILKATSTPEFRSRNNPLYFLDLNAISPASARKIATDFEEAQSIIRFIDGGIIGGPPSLNNDPEKSNGQPSWTKPSIPTSGPLTLASAPKAGETLSEVLRITHISPTIGAASGVKMCFASLTKGYTALAIQSFTTASQMGVLPELKQFMSLHNPSGLASAERGVPGMCPKAYRWVHEMREIGATFEAEGGFESGEGIFGGVAGVYEFVAGSTELGKEVTGRRVRGTTVEDAALLVGEGLQRRKLKTE